MINVRCYAVYICKGYIFSDKKPNQVSHVDNYVTNMNYIYRYKYELYFKQIP